MAEDHPDVPIVALAYSYSWKAPMNLKPLPNVVKRLNTAVGCSHAIGDEECAANAGLRGATADWFRLTNRIYVWDYIASFRQCLMPFPNLHIVGPNIRFLVKHEIRDLRTGQRRCSDQRHGPAEGPSGGQAAKNPKRHYHRAIGEFLATHYCDASKPIQEHLDLLRHEVEARPARLQVEPFEPSIDGPYLTPEIMSRARELFDQAKRLVADNPERLLREGYKTVAGLREAFHGCTGHGHDRRGGQPPHRRRLVSWCDREVLLGCPSRRRYALV